MSRRTCQERVTDNGTPARSPACPGGITLCRKARSVGEQGNMMTDVTTTQPYWDPYQADQRQAPYEAWRRLRDEAPVYHNERFGFWALSRFSDVLAASLDTETFSSAHGI